MACLVLGGLLWPAVACPGGRSVWVLGVLDCSPQDKNINDAWIPSRTDEQQRLWSEGQRANTLVVL